jgi:hypothetical protein
MEPSRPAPALLDADRSGPVFNLHPVKCPPRSTGCHRDSDELDRLYMRYWLPLVLDSTIDLVKSDAASSNRSDLAAVWANAPPEVRDLQCRDIAGLGGEDLADEPFHQMV